MDDAQAVYLSRRLAETRRVQSLAASIRFDLARSGLDDDQLETAVNAFSQQETPSTGWGWSTVLNDLMTREPKRVPVVDMRAYQQNLINLGYASPLTVASGTWDPSWYGASRRFDRDGQEGQMAGKTMLAAPLRQGIELLGQTMPSSIWRNVVGWAKGFVEQTPETVGRVGALGGAVSGAAIGGLVGGPVGAGVGLLVGAGVGFFGDLLSDAPGEEDQSVLASVVDALTPFEEYAGNSKAFFEDLGYVGTIASVIGGVKVGTGLVKGSIEGISSTLANQGAADIQLGLPGSIARWATGKIAPDSLEAITMGIARVSPIAHLAKYPAARMLGGVYSGFSTASVGIHLTAGLGGDARDVNEDIRIKAAALMRSAVEDHRALTQDEMALIDAANRGIGLGTIEKVIAETGVPGNLGSLNMGPQIFGMPLSDWLLPANVLDIASFLFWPQKLFPVVPGAISKTLGKAQTVPLTGSVVDIARAWRTVGESEQMARPLVQYFTGDGISVKEARAFYNEHMNPAVVSALHEQAGIAERTYQLLHDAGVETPQNLLSHAKTRYDLIAKMRAEGEASGGRSATAIDVFGQSVLHPDAFLAHLIRNQTPGKTRQQGMLDYIEVEKLNARTDAAFRAGFSREFMAGPGAKLEYPAGTVFHGSKAAGVTSVEDLSPLGYADPGALAGPGLYLTDDAAVARGYAKTKGVGPEGRVYAAKLTGDLNLVNLDERLPDAVAQTFTDYIRANEGTLGQLGVEDFAGLTGHGAIKKFKQILVDSELTRDEASELFIDLQYRLEQTHGIAGFTYRGGLRRGAKEHNVTVLFDTGDKPLASKVRKGEVVPGESPPNRTTRTQISRLPEGVMTVPYGKTTFVPDALELESRAQRLEADAEKLRLAELSPRASPQDIMKREAEITELKQQAKGFRDLIESAEPKTAWRTLEQYRVTAARLDTRTKGDWAAMEAQYVALRQKMDTALKQTKKALGTVETPGFATPAYLNARTALEELIYGTEAELGWLGRGWVTETWANSALSGKPSKNVLGTLRANARAAAIDADVPDAVRASYEKLGYKPVVTGENTATVAEAEQWIELMGIGDYTRRQSFFDMIGARLKTGIENDLWRVRQANEKSQLTQVAAHLGIRRTAEDLYNKIYGHMEKLNHPSAVNLAGGTKGPFVLYSGVRGDPVKLRLFKIDIRMLKPQDIMNALEDWLPKGKEWDSAMAIYGALRRGAAFGGEWKGLSQIATARAFGHALGLSGLPGFSDVIRTFHLEDPLNWGSKGITANKMSKAKYAAIGAGVGAGAGLVSGDEPSDILRGAAIGAAVGLGGRGFAGRAYGYLPDALVRLNSALRFTLSATFDAGRYSEQAMIGMAKYGLPPGATFAPKRHAMSAAPNGEWKSPYTTTVKAAESWPQIIRHWDDVNGTKWFQQLDELEGRMYQRGMLGFSPRNVEAMQAWLLYQRGWSRPQIEEAVKTIGRYGLGRSAAEKSANFIFFPFSFSKKLLTTLGDWAISAPGRNLLIYEGMRRYYESTLDEDFHSLIEDHFPLLEQLSRVNNLTYGLSPGRWFLKGLGDPRTNEGKAAFILSQFFVPGGLATPIAGTAGQAADLAVNMFVPIVMTGESIDRLGGIDGVDDMIARYIPLSREIQQYWTAVNEQKTAITQGETPWAQVQDYLDARREFTDGLRPMAAMMGFVDPEAFLSSNAGAMWKRQWDDLNLQLGQDYPSAIEALGGFENRTQQSAQVLYELAQKRERGAGEDAILSLAMKLETYERMKRLGFLQGPLADRVESTAVRDFALQHIDDRRFRELYVLLFAREFGPLEVTS